MKMKNNSFDLNGNWIYMCGVRTLMKIMRRPYSIEIEAVLTKGVMFTLAYGA